MEQASAPSSYNRFLLATCSRPSGLTILKSLREDGFTLTLYKLRSRVGGLWAYTEGTNYDCTRQYVPSRETPVALY